MSVKTGLFPERMQLRRLSRVFRKRLWSYVLTRCQRFAFQSPNVSKNGDKRNGHTFDPLGSNVSILSSNNQLLALHNGCQEVVSKGVLDRFVRLSQLSITLIFNTLEVNNKKTAVVKRVETSECSSIRNREDAYEKSNIPQ
jgi:hypothetical protein